MPQCVGFSCTNKSGKSFTVNAASEVCSLRGSQYAILYKDPGIKKKKAQITVFSAQESQKLSAVEAMQDGRPLPLTVRAKWQSRLLDTLIWLKYVNKTDYVSGW